MPLGKWRYTNRVHIGIFYYSGQVEPFEVAEKVALRAIRYQIRTCSSMVYDTTVNAEPTGPASRAGWKTGRIRHITVIKTDCIPANPVYIRAGVAEISVTGKVIRPECININIEYAHGNRLQSVAEKIQIVFCEVLTANISQVNGNIPCGKTTASESCTLNP
jgi:hypothetical protein